MPLVIKQQNERKSAFSILAIVYLKYIYCMYGKYMVSSSESTSIHVVRMIQNSKNTFADVKCIFLLSYDLSFQSYIYHIITYDTF